MEGSKKKKKKGGGGGGGKEQGVQRGKQGKAINKDGKEKHTSSPLYYICGLSNF